MIGYDQMKPSFVTISTSSTHSVVILLLFALSYVDHRLELQIMNAWNFGNNAFQAELLIP